MMRSSLFLFIHLQSCLNLAIAQCLARPRTLATSTAHCSDEEFIEQFTALGAAEMARLYNMSERTVYQRRQRIEQRLSIEIASPNEKNNKGRSRAQYPSRLPVELKKGVMLIGSDAHYWPGEPSTAHRGFIHLAKLLKPAVVVLNGDVVDGASISRHPPIGWEQKPKLKEELEAVDERTEEIRKASPQARHIWTLGNHCQRFENRLAANAREFDGVTGFKLSDHYPGWDFCLSAWVNDSVVIKHRFKGGVHATHNNTLWAGKTMVTGHLHSLKVTPFSDYNGTRYGVDTGTLADPYGEHASYGEDNPLNHRSGFIVLTFNNGALLWPEVCRVVDEEHVEFRGEVIRV